MTTAKQYEISITVGRNYGGKKPTNNLLKVAPAIIWNKAISDLQYSLASITLDAKSGSVLGGHSTVRGEGFWQGVIEENVKISTVVDDKYLGVVYDGFVRCGAITRDTLYQDCVLVVVRELTAVAWV